MAKDHVYHWKHGWIPLTHSAALSKAKGNHKAADKMLEDAKSSGAGIHSREHVAKAAVGLSSIPDAKHRAAALADVHAAADHHNAHDVLPKALQKPRTHPVGSKVDARQPGIDMVTSGEVVGHDEHGMVRVKYADRHGNDAVGTFNPSHVTMQPKADAALERRNNAHVVARTRPTPSAADYTAAAEKWKRDNPGQKLAGHEREVNDIADELWRQKRLNGPDTGATPSQAASERERIRSAASHSSQMQKLGLDKPATVEPSTPAGPALRPAGTWTTHAQPDGSIAIHNSKGAHLGTITHNGTTYVGKMNGQHGSMKHADRQHILDSFYNELNGKDAAQKARGEAALSPAEQQREAFRAGMRQHVDAGKHKVGDAVSIRGEANSKVTIAEIKDGRARVQNSFESGAKGKWMPLGNLVPYGADTGREKPMGGRPVPGTGSTGSSIRRR